MNPFHREFLLTSIYPFSHRTCPLFTQICHIISLFCPDAIFAPAGFSFIPSWSIHFSMHWFRMDGCCILDHSLFYLQAFCIQLLLKLVPIRASLPVFERRSLNAQIMDWSGIFFGKPRNFLKEILSVAYFSISESDNPCHCWSTSIFSLTISSRFGCPPNLVLLLYISFMIGRNAQFVCILHLLQSQPMSSKEAIYNYYVLNILIKWWKILKFSKSYLYQSSAIYNVYQMGTFVGHARRWTAFRGRKYWQPWQFRRYLYTLPLATCSHVARTCGIKVLAESSMRKINK